MVTYVVGDVVAVTVMHVMLFVWHVCVLRECVCDGNVDVESGGGGVAMSACMGGTRGSCVLSSACDVLEMSVARGVGGVCDICMCMCLARVGWEVLGLSG